jgi:hypothetical protein
MELVQDGIQWWDLELPVQDVAATESVSRFLCSDPKNRIHVPIKMKR